MMYSRPAARTKRGGLRRLLSQRAAQRKAARRGGPPERGRSGLYRWHSQINLVFRLFCASQLIRSGERVGPLSPLSPRTRPLSSRMPRAGTHGGGLCNAATRYVGRPEWSEPARPCRFPLGRAPPPVDTLAARPTHHDAAPRRSGAPDTRAGRAPLRDPWHPRVTVLQRLAKQPRSGLRFRDPGSLLVAFDF